MIHVTGEVEGEVQFNRSMTRLVAGSQNLTVPFTKIGEDLRDIEKEQFDAEGYGWVKLSAAYKRWKEKHFPGRKILELTGALRQAMTRKGAPGNVSRVRALSAEFGAEGFAGQKGHWHQLGAGNLPQRKVIALREVDKRMFTKTMHTYMVRLGREAGFVLTR